MSACSTFFARALLLAAAALFVSGAKASAETVVATKWKPLNETQVTCAGHAQSALYRAGFALSDPGSQSMSGKRGDFTASIRCIAEQDIVFFVLAGPSAESVLSYLDSLYGNFY